MYVVRAYSPPRRQHRRSGCHVSSSAFFQASSVTERPPPGWEGRIHHRFSSSLAGNIMSRFVELLRRALSACSCSGCLGVAEGVPRATRGAVLWEGVGGALLQRRSPGTAWQWELLSGRRGDSGFVCAGHAQRGHGWTKLGRKELRLVRTSNQNLSRARHQRFGHCCWRDRRVEWVSKLTSLEKLSGRGRFPAGLCRAVELSLAVAR